MLSAIGIRSLENPAAPFDERLFPSTLAGVPMDPDSALHHLPIYAAVNRIATDCSLPEIVVERLGPDGQWKPDPNCVLTRLLNRTPNGRMTSRRWRQAIMGHVVGRGNGYNELEFNGNGEIVGIHPRSADRMRPDPERPGESYLFRSRDGVERSIPAWRVLHFAGLGWDGVEGYSPIRLARETLGLGLAADRFGAAFLGNAARPSGLLKLPRGMPPDTREAYKKQFHDLHQGVLNAGQVLTVDKEMEFQPWSIAPDDAQFIETRKMSIQDVARLFGIPPHKIGDYSAVPSGSLEESNASYLQQTLLGWCTMLEDEIELKCFGGDMSIRVRHDFSALLRPNALARAQYNATAIQNGWADRNSVAVREGFKPFAGGDRRLVPANMLVLDENGAPMRIAPPIEVDNTPNGQPTPTAGSAPALPALNPLGPA